MKGYVTWKKDRGGVKNTWWDNRVWHSLAPNDCSSRAMSHDSLGHALAYPASPAGAEEHLALEDIFLENIHRVDGGKDDGSVRHGCESKVVSPGPRTSLGKDVHLFSRIGESWWWRYETNETMRGRRVAGSRAPPFAGSRAPQFTGITGNFLTVTSLMQRHC